MKCRTVLQYDRCKVSQQQYEMFDLVLYFRKGVQRVRNG